MKSEKCTNWLTNAFWKKIVFLIGSLVVVVAACKLKFSTVNLIIWLVRTTGFYHFFSLQYWAKKINGIYHKIILLFIENIFNCKFLFCAFLQHQKIIFDASNVILHYSGKNTSNGRSNDVYSWFTAVRLKGHYQNFFSHICKIFVTLDLNILRFLRLKVFFWSKYH